jgi:hypothetical protein
MLPSWAIFYLGKLRPILLLDLGLLPLNPRQMPQTLRSLGGPEGVAPDVSPPSAL